MELAVAEGIDILMIDTAGRLQNKDNLMAELEKIGRIINVLYQKHRMKPSWHLMHQQVKMP